MNTTNHGESIRAEFEMGTLEKLTNDVVGRRKVLSAIVSATEMGTDAYYDGKEMPECFAQVPALERAWCSGRNASLKFEGVAPRTKAPSLKRKFLN